MSMGKCARRLGLFLYNREFVQCLFNTIYIFIYFFYYLALAVPKNLKHYLG